MPERLVDVEKRGSRLLHTFPVTTSAPPTEEEPLLATNADPPARSSC